MIVLRFSEVDIETKIEVKRTTQSHIKKKTYVRGFRSKQDLRILEYYVQDDECSDKSKEISIKTEQRLINNV